MSQETKHGDHERRDLDKWASWLLYQRFAGCSPEERQRAALLLEGIRNRVVERARLKPGDLVLDIGAGTGLVASKAVAEVGEEGLVLAADLSLDALKQYPRSVRLDRGPRVLPLACDGAFLPLRSQAIDAVVMRSVLIYVVDKAMVLAEASRVLRPGGRLSFFEPINRDRVHNVDLSQLPTQIWAKLAEMETMRRDSHDPMLNFDAADLVRMVHAAGLTDVQTETQEVVEEYVDQQSVRGFFNRMTAPGEPTMAEALTRHVGPAGMSLVLDAWIATLGRGPVRFSTPALYVAATKPWPRQIPTRSRDS